MPDRPLEGRVALVTGAGSPEGIGFAAARLLASRGAAVAVTSTTDRIQQRAQELSEAGADAAGFVADLTSFEQAAALAAAAGQRFGRIDILVNNAGIAQLGESSQLRPFAEMDEAQWDRDIAVNLKTAFAITRSVLLGLRLDRHVEGTVDAYFGPAELAERVRSEPLTDAAVLAADAEWLLDALEDGWLRDQVAGLHTFAGVLAGESLSYSDEVERCYG